jgi:thiol-disulfide isomerase/thioredoxin
LLFVIVVQLKSGAVDSGTIREMNWKNIIIPEYVLFFLAPVLFFIASSCSNASNSNKSDNKQHVGEQFLLSNVLDSSGKIVNLDFSKADYTMIDLWFRECPPCVEEMEQFEELLQGKEATVKVISISVNQPWHWRNVMAGASGKLTFLKSSIPNWQHLVLGTTDNPRFRNKISAARVDELEKRYQIGYFPAYFVLNKNGVIIQRPESGVAFLKKF